MSLTNVFGQAAGSRGGTGEHAANLADLQLLDREIAEAYVAIDGRAEVRVQPTEIRVVMAVTSLGETAQECQLAGNLRDFHGPPVLRIAGSQANEERRRNRQE